MSLKNKDFLLSSLQFQKDLGVESTFCENAPSLAKLKKDRKTIAEQKKEKEQVEEAKIKSFEENSSSNKSPSKPATNEDWVVKAKKLADNSKNLSELKLAVENFDGLSIKKLANKCVFGEGNPESDLMFIGEAPGANEDIEGRPFCGVSGQLLDKILEFAGYSRDKNFYITNTVFWRPPGNRKPLPEELAMCRPFLEKHIELVKPKVLVLVGGTASYSVLNDNRSVSLLRKSMHYYNNSYSGEKIPCFAVYHPSYLLRQPSQKKNMWFDVLKIKNFIESI